MVLFQKVKVVNRQNNIINKYSISVTAFTPKGIVFPCRDEIPNHVEVIALNKKKLIVIIILILIFSHLLNGCNNDQIANWGQKYGYNFDEVYQIKIGNYGFPYIEGYINGQKISLLIDTGNLVGTMISQKEAKKINLKQIDKWILQDSSGNIVGEYNIYKVKELKLFDTTFENKKIYMMKNNMFDGSIGIDSLFDKSRITFDYKQEFLGISNTTSSFSKKDLGIPLIWNDRYKGMLVVEGYINGFKTLIQIDTGKSRSCVDEKLIKNLKLPSSQDGYELNNVEIGPYNFKIKNAKKTSFSGISKGYPKPIMLGLGSDILSEIVFTIDYSNKRIIINK
ncbi:MAG: hypothetical protein FH762_10195 [Firmicutes bacterium]|nr:hypothetical protein [Bacillota bacterium]